jgi:hypothetical protein
MHRSAQPADQHHSSGTAGNFTLICDCGRAHLVAGGGMSPYKGYLHPATRSPLADPTELIALALAIVFEGIACYMAYREFRSKVSFIFPAVVKTWPYSPFCTEDMAVSSSVAHRAGRYLLGHHQQSHLDVVFHNNRPLLVGMYQKESLEAAYRLAKAPTPGCCDISS